MDNVLSNISIITLLLGVIGSVMSASVLTIDIITDGVDKKKSTVMFYTPLLFSTIMLIVSVASRIISSFF